MNSSEESGAYLLGLFLIVVLTNLLDFGIHKFWGKYKIKEMIKEMIKEIP